VTVGVGSQLGSSGAGVGSDKGNAQSTSRAGISGVAGNTEARTGDQETGIKPIFDKNRVSEEVNAQITITREFGKQGSTAWGNYSTQQYAKALQNGDEEAAECWGPSGTCRAVGHALIGGAAGGVGGAVGAGVTSMTAPQAQTMLRSVGLPEPMVQALVQGYGLGVGGAVGGSSGAAAGGNEAAHNTSAFAMRLIQIGGGAVLATCFALPKCAQNVGPQLITAVQDLQRLGEAVDETVLRGCRMTPTCMAAASLMGVDVFGGTPGKPGTPVQGPNNTGGDQTENPTPGGNSTTTPNEGPRGGGNTGGNQIADPKPGSNSTVSPIPEPQGPGVVFNEGANGGVGGRGPEYETPSTVVQDRVDNLVSQIPENSRGRITMGVAIVEDADGVRSVVISTSEPRGYLRPGVTLRPGEIVIDGTGHAEADIVSYANANGLRIIDIGATRPVCAGCQNTISPTGANITTPLKPPPRPKPGKP
ncbi:hypothetical protein SAMN05192589_1381, partial [Paracidovorax valerianellae]